MVTQRHAVGAHYGITDWLIQRLTAIGHGGATRCSCSRSRCGSGGIDYSLWQALFGNSAFKLASFLFLVVALHHAWIGMRDIYMDYLKHAGVRLAFETVTVIVLVGYLG